MKIGYARVSTNDQDLTAQQNALLAQGVDEKLIFVDPGLTGANRVRLGLREAMAASRAGDTLVVTKLVRLARSLSDARDIADELTAKGVVLSLGGSTHDPTDPGGGLLFNALGMVAEFEADLIEITFCHCMPPASIRRPNWLSCSGFHGRPCIANSKGAPSEDRCEADCQGHAKQRCKRPPFIAESHC